MNLMNCAYNEDSLRRPPMSEVTMILSTSLRLLAPTNPPGYNVHKRNNYLFEMKYSVFCHFVVFLASCYQNRMKPEPDLSLVNDEVEIGNGPRQAAPLHGPRLLLEIRDQQFLELLQSMLRKNTSSKSLLKLSEVQC